MRELLSISILPVVLTLVAYKIGQFFQSKLKTPLCNPILVAVVLVKLIGGDLVMATMAVIAFSGPSGMNVVVFPASYGQNCETGASIVMVPSLSSILTVPLLYALVQNFF